MLATAVSDRLDEFGPNVSVALVSFSSRNDLGDYATKNRIAFPILLDPNREAYGKFGLGRGTIRRIYSLRSAQKYVQIFREHGLSRVGRPTEDTLQLGGSFVIDAAGVLRYGYWASGPDDQPSIDSLVAAAQRANGNNHE